MRDERLTDTCETRHLLPIGERLPYWSIANLTNVINISPCLARIGGNAPQYVDFAPDGRFTS